MLRRLSRISLVLVFLATSEVWALGLGEIRLQSALNEPFRADIELLSATPEELADLTVSLASVETFARYGIDRPVFLQDIQFRVIESGRPDGNIIELRSLTSMTEPFLTFLVEASWARGRLLREYTVLLDPPTFMPPATTEPVPAVTAPSRAAPADSGRIERAAPPPTPAETTPIEPPTRAAQPAPQVQPEPAPRPETVPDDTPYDTVAGGDFYVARGDTLWSITQRVRPDGRLTMNQTMLAIFEANPQAFRGNINRLEAGATLRIPSADDVFRISRGEALAEVQRQHVEWGGAPAPVVDDVESRPSLTLVPPDEDYLDAGAAADTPYGEEPLTREQEIEQRIEELLAADVPEQQSLIEIRDNELAALRQELAEIRGEIYEPPVEDTVPDDIEDVTDDAMADDQLFVDDDIMIDGTVDDAAIDDQVTEPVADTEPAVADEAAPVRPTREPEPTLLERALDILTSFWTMIGAALLVVGGLLLWFMRRGREDVDEPEAWRPLDADEAVEAGDSLTATETLSAPVPEDDSFVVVEQTGGAAAADMEETVDAPAPDLGLGTGTFPAAEEETAATGQFGSLEDTFSSETAVNLDQSDPVAEADFHMAYGLYDQAADLINGALDVEPEREDLLTKLCEIYFVWGNRDAFVDAAGRLKGVVGEGDSAAWDKIVIMGQQIAADDALFAGAGVAGATKAVDLAFEGDTEEAAALDMEFLADAGATSDVVDLGEPEEVIDFDLAGDDLSEEVAAAVDLEETAESPTVETTDFDVTAEMPTAESTVEMPTTETTLDTPTIEQQFDELGATSELPSIDEAAREAAESDASAGEATAEINLDDLGLDLGDLEETEVASLDDLDATSDTGAPVDVDIEAAFTDSGVEEALEDTGVQEALAETGLQEALSDEIEDTGRNPEVDPNATGVQAMFSDEDTGIQEALDATGTDVEIEQSLLEATGITQVLPEDLAVETVSDVESELGDEDATLLAPDYGDEDETEVIGDEEQTMLAGLDDEDEEEDYDFAKTEALPAEVFTGDATLDETGELPAVASTDVDLDLDDLTAALQVSEVGDTIEQVRDDATVEQPRPSVAADQQEHVSTMSLGPDDISDDLHEARTMTEVGTKLDLARAYVDMGDPAGARSILEEVLDEGDESQRQQAQQLLDTLPT